jgi:ferredoxin-type protein NapG
MARKKKKRRPATRQPVSSRRFFFAQGMTLLGGGAAMVGQLLRPSAWANETERAPIRPPTAGDDEGRFRSACIRCGLCGTVCENGCIRFFATDETRWGALTPYLDVRRRSCTLCMRCTQICPTGALTAVKAEKKAISENVDMGVAVVDPDRCISYLGRVCGYCHDACPLPQKAIRLLPPGKPVVIEKGCVGCGRCVELCPQSPTAIDVQRKVVS